MTESTVEREGTGSEAAKSLESMEAKSTKSTEPMFESTAAECEGTGSESKATVTNKATLCSFFRNYAGKAGFGI
jgi:hypothetical protein